MNRAERRRAARRAPRGQHKAAERWMKGKCDSCLIGDHKHCARAQIEGEFTPRQFEELVNAACQCGCMRIDWSATEEQGDGVEAPKVRSRLWTPWSRRRP